MYYSDVWKNEAYQFFIGFFEHSLQKKTLWNQKFKH